MKHEKPPVRLPMADGTYRVFCEASYRRVRPCHSFAIFTRDGDLIRGSVLYDGGQDKPRYFCGHHCLSWYVRGA